MAQQGDSVPPPGRTAGWQLMLVAVALTIFAVKVAIPGTVIGIGSTAIIGLAVAAAHLKQMGALTTGVFEGTAQLSFVFIGMALMAFVAISAWNAYRRLKGRTPPPVLFRRPWALLGLMLFLMCELTVPDSRQPSTLPVLPGALVITFTVWGTIAVSALLLRLSISALRLSWRVAKASPFGAGALTLGVLAATGSASVVESLAEAFAARLQSVSAARHGPCDSLTWECSRQALLAAQAPIRLLTPALEWEEEAPSGAGVASLGDLDTSTVFNTRACLEKTAKQPELMDRARSIAQSIIRNSADVEDLVHAILLNICLRKTPPQDFEPYFLRAVRYGALKRFGRAGDTCTLDSVPDPICFLRPDDEYVEAESHAALRKAICGLSEQHQQVIQMRYFQDLDETEIGLLLRIDHGTARKRVQRARDQLRILFLQQCQ